MKSQLSERDICIKYITPDIQEAGWKASPHHFREEVYFTAGRIHVRGKFVNCGKGGRSARIIFYVVPKHRDCRFDMSELLNIYKCLAQTMCLFAGDCETKSEFVF